ncbi:MAG: hypothetical protein U5K53_06420 [Halanaerobiales bacterium]|nr:hypothetical protein [Halanaerobiales bacterium]
MDIKNSKALKKHNQYALLNEIINRQPISRSNLTQHCRCISYNYILSS